MIGIFDSGVGGLAVLRQVAKLLPRADILYLADTAAFPYGPRSTRFVKSRTAAITRFLIQRGAQLVVVACNTATVVAIRYLREVFDIPFVGVEPPVKVAAELAGHREPICVLLTQNTASGKKYADLVKRFSQGRRVEAVCLPLLAQVVEDGSFRNKKVAAQVVKTVKNALGELTTGAKLVLGCTHYIFLQELLQEALGPSVKILEPGRSVAEQVRRLMTEHGIGAEENGRRNFYCTGDADGFAGRVENLLGIEKPEVERVEVRHK